MEQVSNGVHSLRRMRWAGHVAWMGAGRGMYRVLVGKPEGKRPLVRRRHRWEDNIKMDLQEVRCGSMFRRYILPNTTRQILTRTHYIGDMFWLTL
jgi:hypothetical protein